MQRFSSFQNFALFLLRLIIAAIFFVAAWYKIPFWKTPPPGISSFMLVTTRILSIAEPLGALAVLIGYLTRLASTGLTIIMIGAILVSQFMFGIGFVTPTSAGWNMPLSVLSGCVILIAFGAGQWSVDWERRRK